MVDSSKTRVEEKTEDPNRFSEAVSANLDILTDLYQNYYATAAMTSTQLISIENGPSLFSYKRSNLKRYKHYKIKPDGECVIVKIGDNAKGRCHIHDLKM